MKTSLEYKLAVLLSKIGIKSDPKQSPAVQLMNKKIKELGSDGIQFQVEDLGNGKWSAVSTNLPGIITGGDKKSDIDAMIKDATLAYFEIPAKYCIYRLLLNEEERAAQAKAAENFFFEYMKEIYKINDDRVKNQVKQIIDKPENTKRTQKPTGCHIFFCPPAIVRADECTFQTV